VCDKSDNAGNARAEDRTIVYTGIDFFDGLAEGDFNTDQVGILEITTENVGEADLGIGMT